MVTGKFKLLWSLLKRKNFFAISIDESTGEYEYQFCGDDKRLYNLFFHLGANFVPGWLRRWNKAMAKEAVKMKEPSK